MKSHVDQTREDRLKIELRNLTVRYGRTVAVDDVSLSLAPGRIYGLLGRNAAGKTSLLSVLAAFRKASAGKVLIDGADPFEDPRRMGDICFIRDRVDAQESSSVRSVLAMAAALRPRWDADFAKRLVDLFDLPPRKQVSKLSRGQQSALGITIGLASRAPLTILDESYLGLDAPSRYAFYDELLADYVEHPRTFIISTHLIEEVGRLFEDVVILQQGRLLLHETSDELRARGASVTGPVEAVDRFVEDLTVLSEQRLGSTKSAMVIGPRGPLTPEHAVAARTLGLELGPVGLQDLFVHLTRASAAPGGASLKEHL